MFKNISKNINKVKIIPNVDTIVFSIEGMEFEIIGSTIASVIDKDGVLIDRYGNRVSMLGAKGTHSMHVRTMKSGKQLKFSGSPYAFRYGQNVFTNSNVKRGCFIAIRSALKKFAIKPTDELIKRWKEGDVTLYRVDLAANFLLKSEQEVIDVLKQVRRQLGEQMGTTKTNGTTVYWSPKNGKEYTVGFYAKGPQMRRQKRYRNLSDKVKILKVCERILRVEVRLFASELRKLKLDKASAWKSETAELIFRKYMAKLKIFSVSSGAISTEELQLLPSRLRPVFVLHKAGQDLSKCFQPRTLQRHTRDFREIGIDLRCPNQMEGSVTSLSKYLSPRKVMNVAPKWMVRARLIPPTIRRNPAK